MAARKLTMEQAREIRARETDADVVLAREFGMSPQAVRFVRLGITYREEGMVVRASPWARRSRKYGTVEE